MALPTASAAPCRFALFLCWLHRGYTPCLHVAALVGLLAHERVCRYGCRQQLQPPSSVRFSAVTLRFAPAFAAVRAVSCCLRQTPSVPPIGYCASIGCRFCGTHFCRFRFHSSSCITPNGLALNLGSPKVSRSFSPYAFVVPLSSVRIAPTGLAVILGSPKMSRSSLL